MTWPCAFWPVTILGNPRLDPRYAGDSPTWRCPVPTLQDTVARVRCPRYLGVRKALRSPARRTVGRSLRQTPGIIIIKKLKGASRTRPFGVQTFRTAVPCVFEFDEGPGYVSIFSFSDPPNRQLMEAVANQGSVGLESPVS